jgi:effector-binding domain-containing protein
MKKILFLIIPALLVFSSCKKDYAVERSIVIDAPTDVVWQQVKYFENWQHWSPWYAKDSTMEWMLSGTDGEIESGYSWTSENSGAGEMNMTSLIEGEEVKYHTHFLDPFESESDGYVQVAEIEGGTEVKWGFHGQLKGIAALFMNMDKMVGPDFEEGLELLKSHAENIPAEAPSMQVKEIDMTEKHYVAIREETDITEIQSFYANNYMKIMESGVTMEGGMPSGLYFTWDMENMRTDLAAAIPVVSGTKAPEGTTIITIPESKAVMVDYYGAYEGLAEVHGLIEGYLIANELEYVGPAIEEYITDPEAESDPRKWNTKVTYPIK